LGGRAHSVVAQYSGDPSFNASNSGGITFSITPRPVQPQEAGPATVAPGQNATLTATVQLKRFAPSSANWNITFKKRHDDRCAGDGQRGWPEELRAPVLRQL